MSNVVKARYDAEHNALRLVVPLEGVSDTEEVELMVMKPVEPERPWMAFSGILSEKAGESFSRALDEMFGDSIDE